MPYVCFKQRNGVEIIFKASKTKSACPEGAVFRKSRVGKKEMETLGRLRHKRLPRLVHKEGSAAVMTNKGKSLDEAVGSRRGIHEGKRIVREHSAQLKKDLTKGISYLKSIGLRHADLDSGAPRNITWDGKHFNIIDFGIMKQDNGYDVASEVDKVYTRLLNWSKS